MCADLRPERVVAADEEYRELGFLGHGNGLPRSGLRRGGLTFPCCVLHRHPPLIVTQARFAALQFRSTRDVERLRRHAGKILMEIRISRDGLDHILDAVEARTRVGAGRDVPKVRTTSHMRPLRGNGAALPASVPDSVSFAFAASRRYDRRSNRHFERSLRYKGPARH